MSVNFPAVEEDVLRLWKDIDAFQTQLRLTEGGPHFNFYDGPPFATGRPHSGHLLASTIKDIVPRYWSMKGYHVPRRFGWDTHGVPVEHIVDKQLGITGREDVLKMGIDKYNAECRAIVMTYASEWKATIERVGRWIDVENDYKSLDPTFMESCWWVFKQLYDNGRVYRAYQIMPFSTALCTPLSHMESKQNEKMTQDPAVVVAFPVEGVKGMENTSFLAYTTTPWTLPSNLFVAVHPNFEYAVVLDEPSGQKYVILETSLSVLYQNPAKAKYKVVEKLLGRDMVGWKYSPLFPYFTETFGDCFQVIGAEYVEAGEGTGLVHQAPAFGQEDYDAAVAAGFITPERLPPCPVDDNGCFTAEVPDYQGQHVKAADKAILKDLRGTGRLLVESQVVHNDKFCWRSDTQLIRKAVSSWFIRVADSVPQLLENVHSTNWVPQSVKNRFVNWVANARDWNVSRNRYWGTPLPLWVSEDLQEVVCIGSIAELRQLSGYDGPLDDLHRDKVDHITIPSRRGKGVLRRVDEVFDCWYESGCMPYASRHYPFSNPDKFPSLFPADFIAEGLDQTRGWFYSLTVLGNELFKTSPFRNVIVNGIVLAEDGKKMSKRLKNYTDPMEMLNHYGADALRLYLITSPAVKAESLRFKDSGVKDVISRVLLPLWNSYRFLADQAVLYKKTTGRDFVADLEVEKETNVMDRWILADCQSLLRFMDEEMAGYRLHTVVPRLLGVIDNLTNWYIRFNRKRLKGTAGLPVEDTASAMNTLFRVLFTLVRALAPFIPFLTEHIYGLLKPHLSKEALGQFRDSRSVHFLPFPTVQESLFDEATELRIATMQKVIQLARGARERSQVPLKTPLRSLVVVADPDILAHVEALASYIKEELNVRDVVLSSDEQQHNILLEARVDWPTLGKKLKKDVQLVRKALPGLSQEELRRFVQDKTMLVGGIKLVEDDITILRVLKDSRSDVPAADGVKWEPAFADDMVVLLDTTASADLASEGVARELVNRVQRLRKKAGLVPTDDVRMQCAVLSDPGNVGLAAVVASHEALFVSALRGKLEDVSSDVAVGESLVLQEEQEIGGLRFRLQLLKA